MADYFTHFSFNVTLPTEAAFVEAKAIFEKFCTVRFGDPVPVDLPKALKEFAEDAYFDMEDSGTENTLWFNSDCGGIDAVCVFVQHLLQRFDPTAVVSFQWADGCSKPRLDAYGGGAAVITAKSIVTKHTSQWVSHQLKRIENRAARKVALATAN